MRRWFALSQRVAIVVSLAARRLSPLGCHAFQPQRLPAAPTVATLAPAPKQTLCFADERTGITVHLVGSMHYNPHSIAKASDIVRAYGEAGFLGSVVVEQCPSRWERVQSMHPPGSTLRPVLDNEMQAAAEAGEAFGLRVVLGDEEIETVDRRIKDVFKQTVMDILNPFGGGWASIADDLKNAWTEAVDPSWSSRWEGGDEGRGGGDSASGGEYLSMLDLFEPQLMLAAPMSFVRYPLAILIKAPLQGLVLFAVLTFLTIHGPAELMADNMAYLTRESALDLALEGIGGLGAFALETVLLSRVFLTVLLVERNRVLAENIRLECVRLKRESDGGNKVCVAVLGMAHCNGVKSILCGRQR